MRELRLVLGTPLIRDVTERALHTEGAVELVHAGLNVGGLLA
jgi:hypothetical protein